jgi:Bacterial antitoxin of type II TA system, VapB
VISVATNLQIDDSLITKAIKLGKHKTKKAAVTQALIDYIQHLEQEKIFSMFGTVDHDPEYDYRKTETSIMKVIVDTSVWSLALRRDQQGVPYSQLT